MPGARTPLAGRTPAEIDFYVVRENTEGEYSSVARPHVRGDGARSSSRSIP
jgi:isocitrate/isopropylmalate dehydrogenase